MSVELEGTQEIVDPPPDAPGLTRRELLGTPWRGLAVAGVAAAAIGTLAACDPGAEDPNFHIVRRLTYGVTGVEVSRMGSLGRDAWLAEQLAPSTLSTTALDAKLAAFPALTMSVVQLQAAYPDGVGAAQQLQLASIIRQVHSPAQLFERMVELWSDHFNVPVDDAVLSWLKVVEDREVIRANALGRFADLLLADARSPAMLRYLDNAVSFRGAYNENYGRELMELHTVGVDAGYTQADVVSVARLLTGWTIDPDTGLFRYLAAGNDPAPLTIMGWTRPTTGTGYDHGVAFLAWLARHPNTATRICRKIATRFVGDNPDAGLVATMAAAYTANDTAIVPVLQTMVAHTVFLNSARGRFRRPLHQAAAVMRAVNADLRVTPALADVQALGGIAYLLGQVPFSWPAPNGYPDAEGAWLTTGGLLARWNATGALVSGASQVSVDWAKLTNGLADKAPSAVVDGMAKTVLHEPITAPTRDAIVSALLPTPPPTLTAAQVTLFAPAVATLLLSIPDFQYC